jgi:hypothetical protein
MFATVLPLLDKDPALLAQLDAMVEPGSRGDRMYPLRWTSKSTATSPMRW